MHRQFVMGYREERQRVEDQIYEVNKGYATEIAEHYRTLREQGTPAITFKQYLMHRDRAPEAAVTEPSIDPPLTLQGNKFAEQSLLAIAMYDQHAVAILRELDTNEFLTPLNQKIAESILTLEDHGIRADAVAVETDLHRIGVPSTPEWDSEMALPGVANRNQRGLRAWEFNAGVYDNARSYAGEIRQQSNAYRTEQVYEWGASMIRGGYHSSDGISQEYTSEIQAQVSEKISNLPPPLVIPPRVNALDYAMTGLDQTKTLAHTVSRDR